MASVFITLSHLGGLIPINYVLTNPVTFAVTLVSMNPGDGPLGFQFTDFPCGVFIIPVTANGDDVSVNVNVDCCGPDAPPETYRPAGLIACRDEASLGDGADLRVLLMTRGGGAVIAELNPISGNFTRELDGTSSLAMEGLVSGRLGDVCCDGWEDVDPWATEVIVYRDGRDAWCGPVTDVLFEYGSIRVEADDLTSWWDRRLVGAFSLEGVDLSTIFMTIHDSAMSPDPSPNIQIDLDPSGLFGSRSVLTSEFVYAADLIDELAKTGLDYTAFGRTIIVRGIEVDTAPLLTLLDDDWTAPPSIRKRGNEQATVVVVKGNGVQSIVTASAQYLSYYGILVRTFTEDTIVDQASCDRAAQTRLDILKDPLYIETPVGARLKTTAGVRLDQLIPGTRVRVDTQASCYKVVADFRLQKVDVNFDGSVSIDLQPLGTIESTESG